MIQTARITDPVWYHNSHMQPHARVARSCTRNIGMPQIEVLQYGRSAHPWDRDARPVIYASTAPRAADGRLTVYDSCDAAILTTSLPRHPPKPPFTLLSCSRERSCRVQTQWSVSEQTATPAAPEALPNVKPDQRQARCLLCLMVVTQR